MKCKQCNFETPMVSDFRHHMYLIHNAKKPNFHRCENCNEKFYNFEDLLIHRDEGKCGGTDHHHDHDIHMLSIDETNSDQVNDKIKLEDTVRLPTLRLERLTAEMLVQHSKTLVTSTSSQKIRICILCKSHISHKNLITHIRAIHINCNTFKCSLCVKGFNDKMALNNHILQHHTTVRPFLCNLCGTGFSARKYVVPHILGCLKNNWKKCQTSSDNKNGTVDDYVEEVTGEVPCPMCKAVCSNYSTLVNHMKRHRLVYPGDKVKIAPVPEKVEHNEKKLHECELCPMKFFDFGNLVIHKRVHQKSTGVAAKRFRKKLKQSNQMKIGSNKNGANGTIFAKKSVANGVPVANKNNEDDNDATDVIISKNNSKVFLCDYVGCQYVTKNEANMRRHKKCVHKEGVTEFDREKVALHCHLCMYVSNQQGNLVRHLANHHNVGDLQKCNICSFESYSKEKIKTHLKKVHHVRPTATCKGCNREFKSHYEMKVHHWQHLRENTSCGDGDNSYLSKPKSKSKKSALNPNPSLSAIKKRKGSDQSDNKVNYVCKDCGKSFIRKRYLQKHIDCMHTNSDDDIDDEPYEMKEPENLPLETPQQTHSSLPAESLPVIEPDEFAALNFSSQQIRVIEIDAI